MIPDGTIFGEEPNYNLSAAKPEKGPSRSFGRKVARLLGFEKPQPLGRRDPLSRRPGVYIRSAEAGPPVLPADLIESIKNGSALRPRVDQPSTPEKPQTLGRRSLSRRKSDVYIRSAEGDRPILSPKFIENINNGSALRSREEQLPTPKEPQPLGHRGPNSPKPDTYIRAAEGDQPMLSPELVENIKNGSALEPKPDAAPPVPFDI